MPPLDPRTSPGLQAPPTAWHRERRAAILESHPELRHLSGPNAWTALAIAGTVAAQFAIAYATRHGSIFAIVVIAWLAGGFLAHACGVLVHECAHNLVFRSNRSNKLAALVANMPLLLPGAIDFREKHLAHHRHLGEGPGADFQAPTPAAVAWTSTSRIRKLVWLAFGSLIFPNRAIAAPGPAHEANRAWRIANVVLQIVACGILYWTCGARGLSYLALSSLFAFGPHPVGMRGFAEHFDARPEQPTNSYYGALNHLSYNVGFHVEHHDLPTVPWNRLPEVRRRAARFYDDLAPTTSWIGLLVRFLSDASVGVGRYVGIRASAGPRGRSSPRIESAP